MGAAASVMGGGRIAEKAISETHQTMRTTIEAARDVSIAKIQARTEEERIAMEKEMAFYAYLNACDSNASQMILKTVDAVVEIAKINNETVRALDTNLHATLQEALRAIVGVPKSFADFSLSFAEAYKQNADVSLRVLDMTGPMLDNCLDAIREVISLCRKIVEKIQDHNREVLKRTMNVMDETLKFSEDIIKQSKDVKQQGMNAALELTLKLRSK